MSLASPVDARLTSISAWLASLAAPVVHPASLRPASADASFRRYFRVDGADGNSYIVMDAPPPQENVERFVNVADILRKTGVTVPQVYAQDLDHGFLLLGDLGATTYLNQLNNDSASKLYLHAIDALVLMQVGSQPDVLPEYDRATLLRELMLFPEWYVGKHLGLTLTDKQNAALNGVFDALLARALAQPQVIVHRDYHSRNLMVLAAGNPGILDFQDAVYGPITYDIVSLLRDAYVQWDEEMVLDWAIRYWERARRAGLPVSPDIDGFYQDFEYMGVQRHLKILGIFARLHHRDGKDHYLNDMPLVLHYLRKAAARYKPLAPLSRLFDELEDKQPQTGYTF
jgi:aminoglycoside/choline kinase family phosphotransferase